MRRLQVDKILGPGNQYVTAAKMLLQNSEAMIAMDMPAGPSEVLVIADSEARPAFIAADLLSQAEHGPDSQVPSAPGHSANPKTLQPGALRPGHSANNFDHDFLALYQLSAFLPSNISGSVWLPVWSTAMVLLTFDIN